MSKLTYILLFFFLISLVQGNVYNFNEITLRPEHDINQDGVVNYADLISLVNAYKQQNDQKDVNNDGIIDLLDLLEVSRFLGETVSRPSCSDGIQNGNEGGVDCGGNCQPCQVQPTCNDGIQNGGETGVDCGGSCGSCSTSCDLTVTGTIQQAINSASNGQTVCVPPGTYHEVVTINKPLTLKAKNPGNKPIIDGRQTIPGGCQINDPQSSRCATYDPLISITSSNVVVDGVKIHRSKGRGIRIHDYTSPPRNVVIKNVVVSEVYWTGIMALGLSESQPVKNIKVLNSEITRNGVVAPYVRPSSVLDWSASFSFKYTEDVTINNNYVHHGFGEGLLIDSNTGSAKNLVAKCNTFRDIMRPSIYIHGNVDGIDIQNNHAYSTNDQPNGGWDDGLVIVETEPQFTNRGLPKHHPRNGVAKNNKIENGVFYKNPVNIQISNNGPNVHVNCP